MPKKLVAENPVYYVRSDASRKVPLYNRELSWLSFNYRVLQEAKNEENPLYERIKFMAIYSSNLEEFFKVRVASLRHMANLNERALKKLNFEPRSLHLKILQVVEAQQQEFLDHFYKSIVPSLQEEGIQILNDSDLNKAQAQFVRDYFEHNVRPWTRPMLIVKNRISAFLKNNTLYLLLRMVAKPESGAELEPKGRRRFQYASLEIPTDHCARWLVLPAEGERQFVMFLDDVVRCNLESLFPGYDILEARAVKLTRDADLDIDDEYSGNLVTKIRRLIEKRMSGLPSRFVYDRAMSVKALRYFSEAFGIRPEDQMPGDRYLAFEDLYSFPRFGRTDLEFPPMQPLKLAGIDSSKNILDQISGKEILLYYPYHDYDPVLAMLHYAARDPQVHSIKITLYRIAKESRVIKALRKAAEKGIDVTVFAELKARFDELSNIQAAEKLESSGVNVLYSLPGLKVHTKLCLITRKEGENFKRYAYLGTGNFNEQTARLYCDFGFFTTDVSITNDARNLFRLLAGVPNDDYKFASLMVAPASMRTEFYKLIDYEIRQAKQGRDSGMWLKMNSLEDKRIIAKLYEASRAGVPVRINVRGICCLVPGVPGRSENIEAISIVGRFLEHARVYIFYHGGQQRVWLASADWMTRNLTRRIETAFEITSPNLKRVVLDIFDIQWRDNVKARILDSRQENYLRKPNDELVNSQMEIYEYLRQAEPVVDCSDA
jgi:polyphosphate kinase